MGRTIDEMKHSRQSVEKAVEGFAKQNSACHRVWSFRVNTSLEPHYHVARVRSHYSPRCIRLDNGQ